MRIPLTSTRRTVVFLALSFLAFGAYVTCAFSSFLADHSAASGTEQGLRQAVRLEPWNAGHWNALGRHLLFTAQDVPGAVAALNRATTLNREEGHYWLDLAVAYAAAGNTQAQTQAIREAVQLDPRTPDIAWQAGNLYFAQGDVRGALQQLRAVLENDPASVDAALDLSWRGTNDVAMVLREAMPPLADPHLAFIRYLAEHNQPLAAAQVWKHLVASRLPVRPQTIFGYIFYLLQEHEPEQARAVWTDMAHLDPALDAYASQDNLIVNGGFDEEVLNGGLDWQFRPIPGATLRIDSTEFHGGRASLCIRFDGVVDQAGVLQVIPVLPATQYGLTAFVKTEQIDSGSGPRLQLADGYTGVPVATAEDDIGSTPWHQVQLDVSTSPNTRLLVLRVVRVPATTLVQGKMWLDDVRLVPKR